MYMILEGEILHYAMISDYNTSIYICAMNYGTQPSALFKVEEPQPKLSGLSVTSLELSVLPDPCDFLLTPLFPPVIHSLVGVITKQLTTLLLVGPLVWIAKGELAPHGLLHGLISGHLFRAIG